jgi:hypothetical protein
LIDPKIEEYFYDLLTLRDAAKALISQTESNLAHSYISFCYDMACKYPARKSDSKFG